MRPDEPVELLQLTRLPDEHVLGDRIEVLGGVHDASVRLDDPGVHHIQRTEMLQGACPAYGIVVPVTLADQRARRPGRRAAERGAARPSRRP
jgi:hypothetical protein